MGTSRVCVFKSPIYLLHQLKTSKVQHPNRQQRPRPHIRLLFAHDHLRPGGPIYVHRRWHNSVDESGAPRPGKLQVEEESTHKGIGLLCARDGGIRSFQWTGAILPIYEPSSQDPSWRPPWEASTSKCHRSVVENDAAVLEC